MSTYNSFEDFLEDLAENLEREKMSGVRWSGIILKCRDPGGATGIKNH